VIEGRAVLFCGPSGRGKSTLALMASSAGCPVAGEDGAVVEIEAGRALVWPGARGILAAQDGRRSLSMLHERLEARGPVPVGAVCFLAARGAELQLDAMSPARAVPALVPSLIHAGDENALRTAFEGLVGLLELVPAFRVTMPDDLAGAPQATRSLVARFSASSAAFRAPSQPSSRAASSELRPA
jgi:energy-coupling factor transporter ATP-binding protein EcfA2